MHLVQELFQHTQSLISICAGTVQNLNPPSHLPRVLSVWVLGILGQQLALRRACQFQGIFFSIDSSKPNARRIGAKSLTLPTPVWPNVEVLVAVDDDDEEADAAEPWYISLFFFTPGVARVVPLDSFAHLAQTILKLIRQSK